MAIALLHDMMHNEVDVYVDDMIVKSKDREGHIANLRKLFERIKEYRLRLNPQKCTFGITMGNLLGFMANDKRIEVDWSKIKAILDIKGFLGWLQYISQFIAKLTSTCKPIFKPLRKNEPMHGMMSVRKTLSSLRISSASTYPSTLKAWKATTPLSLDLRRCGWEYACTRE